MEHDVYGLGDLDVVDHVVVHEREGVVADVLEVREGARLEVVHAYDAVILREEVLAKVRAEEAGSAGDDCAWHEGAGYPGPRNCPPILTNF